VTSGTEYDLTKPITCRRIVEAPSRGAVLKLDIGTQASADIDISFDGGAAGSFNTLSDDSAFLTELLVGLGATDSDGIIIGKHVFISPSTLGVLDVTAPANVVKSTCNEWVLSEEEGFYLSDVPEVDLVIGDLVKVHFSMSQGGVIVPDQTAVTVEECCTQTVINSSDLQITIPTYVSGVATGGSRVLNTTRTWILELKRDVTYTIVGGFAMVAKGKYPMVWSSVTSTWGRNAADDLVFFDQDGRVIFSNTNIAPYVTVNSATMSMTPDDGAGNVAVNVTVDATVTTA